MTPHARPRTVRQAAAGLLATVLAACALAGCGELDETGEAVTKRDRVTLMLDYFPNANHAAIYAAQSSGAFDRAGLDVRIQPPPDASAPLAVLQAGRADFVVSYEPEILLARDEGAKVQGVAALVQAPLTSIISLRKDPVRTARDLEGKTVGTAGIPYQSAYLKTILATGRVPASSVKRVDLDSDLNAPLLAGRVDATLGGFWNYEGLQLQRDRRRPVVTKIEDLGVPTYDELVLTATEDTVRNRGELVRRVVQAIGYGAAAVRTDPSVGIDPLLRASKGLDRGLQEASLRATLPVMFPADEKQPFGWLDTVEWATYARWMQANGLIDTARVAARATTNEYLAGEGVGDRTSS